MFGFRKSQELHVVNHKLAISPISPPLLDALTTDQYSRKNKSNWNENQQPQAFTIVVLSGDLVVWIIVFFVHRWWTFLWKVLRWSGYVAGH